MPEELRAGLCLLYGIACHWWFFKGGRHAVIYGFFAFEEEPKEVEVSPPRGGSALTPQRIKRQAYLDKAQIQAAYAAVKEAEREVQRARREQERDFIRAVHAADRITTIGNRYPTKHTYSANYKGTD